MGLLLFFVVISLIVSTISALAFMTSAKYAVTDRRVMAKYGLIKRSSVDVILAKISGVRVNQGLLGRLFDFGNVWVQSSGANRRVLFIQSAKKFRAAILTQLEESRLLKGTVAYTLEVTQASPGPNRPPASPVKPTSAPPLPPGTPAQWHKDPFDESVMRYWDGDRWTDHTAPAS